MSLRPNRRWLVLGLLLASDVWALGLGDIRLNSALNEPLRAEIQLLSATPEELANLKVALAPQATFERYGLDRPFYLTRLQFSVVDGGPNGQSRVRITSSEPITEPFVTFLVEATWARGRMLREYTVLLDPPTFAPPPSAQSSQALQAPSRAAPADSGRIERPAQPAASQPPAAAEPRAFDSASGTDVHVQRGDTLWEIASRVRPDNRISMNQMMVAIYEANPEAFAGNLNRLNAGATLRVPGADDIFRISRGDAMSEVQRQNAAWNVAGTAGKPSLTLVPPDADQPGQTGYEGPSSSPAAGGSDSPATRARIRELEETIAEQNSLIEIRDNELAQLRDELARLRASQAAATEPAAPPDAAIVDEEPVEEPAEEPVEESTIDDEELFADDEETAAEDEAAEEEAEPAPAVTPERPAPRVIAQDEPGMLDRALGALTGFWGILGLVLLLVLAILVWLAKRAAGRGEEESTGVWEALDSDDDIDSESRASTERLRALARDEDSSIVVVEQETDRRRSRRHAATGTDFRFDESSTATSAQPTFEDTFSSETAINLDQSDPVAEADFHMAYGLYDQAADLINGALAVEPERLDLMAKLCEIYFVWGNQDAFIEAATRLHDQLGGESTPDWDKIVIMGQQIAGSHRLFSGKSAAGAASRTVDLSFDSDDSAAALDMDFGSGPDGEVSHVVDLGADDGSESDSGRSSIDFLFEEEPDTSASITRDMPRRGASLDETIESPTVENTAMDSPTMESPTVESPTVESAAVDRTMESPTMERPVDDGDGTSELPAISDADDESPWASDATAEIDLADLGLDLDDLAKSGLDGSFDDDELAANTDFSDFDVTSESSALRPELDDTGRNIGLPGDDENADTGFDERFDMDDMDDAAGATSEMPVLDEETGKNPAWRDELDKTDADVDFDSTLLDATGHTQVLGDDYFGKSGKNGKGVEDDDRTTLSPEFDDDAQTLLASADDEDYTRTAALSGKDVGGDFDFAKTEALPKDTFDRNASADDETGEMPIGSTDLDLDLDDLTSALRYSEGDTVDQPRDDATIEQRLSGRDHNLIDLDFGELDDIEDNAATEALSPDDFSDDLHDARTMTEVGTKLDLARAYVDMGDPDGARSILEEVLDEGDEGQKQQAQRLIESLPA
jgi:pilus assembly protein FimV